MSPAVVLILFLAVTVQRDIYLKKGTNIPVRMNETLTSALTDFTDILIGDQDEEIFSEIVKSCMVEPPRQNVKAFTEFLRVCNLYNANGRLVYLGFD